ncbi:MAG TPA: SDR family oxidoreductase [Pseudonocardiaceae bacterium]|jgi:3-oxoacyl-[acyl-carrier protein] reductase|nr:SDR family oxidoreductase [Pseudonocardiaceae bacterium]
MDLGIDGRVALVCASTAGLGLASARALAAEGAHVVVSGRRADLAQQIAAELPKASAVQVDLTAAGAPDELVDAATAAAGPIDILVLNGPGPVPGPAAGLTPAGAAGAIDALLLGHLQLIQRVLPGMRERGWGRIVAIGSSGVAAPLPNLAASNAGRAALAGYLKTLAGEVAADGVTVNMVLPGRIATDRVADLDRRAAERTNRSVEEVRAGSEATIPLGRYGHPEEFGATVAFLAGVPASYVTGGLVRCDGGLVGSI